MSTPNEQLMLPVVLCTAPDGRLTVRSEDMEQPVTLHPCFPWREARRYIALLNEDGEEVAFIDRIEALDETSRQALETALDRACFTLEVEAILTLEKEIEIRHWKVVVDGVERRFQTELDEWPVEQVDGRLLITDVAGDLYSIRDPQVLDAHSRSLLWALTR